jgi:dTDP-4-dehydrorhamnose reductase
MINTKTIIITGGNGMVASQANFGIKLDKEKLDILNKKSIQKAINFYKPDVILHLAAMTDMLGCENNPRQAYKTNVMGTRNIAEACRKNKIKLIYLSSGVVLGGKKRTPYKENDKPKPVNVYGKTKLLGEIEAQKIVPGALIVRTGWLFGGGPAIDKKFIFSIFQQMRKGLEVKATADRIGSPTYIPDLLDAIKKLIDKNASGVFHAVNSGAASYSEVAKEIKKIGKFSSPVVGVKAAGIENPKLKRGTMEALASSKIKLRHWKKSLKQYISYLAKED